MEEEKRKSNEELMENLTNQIVSNSKDAKWAKDMVHELLRLQKQSDNMNKEIDIPLSDITDAIDFGACVLKKYKRGFIFEAKGGMQTVVSWRMKSVCEMCQILFDYRDKDDLTEGEKTIRDNYRTAIEFVFQAPIMSSLDARALFDNAKALLQSFTEYASEKFAAAEAENVEETEEDIKANIEAENVAKAVDIITESLQSDKE